MQDIQPASQLNSSSLPSNDATMSDDPKSAKTPVVRGARACTVCRAAKMKCVVTEDGSPCQRCARSGSECIFEKHRRGRKPGSKLSEASKTLRRLEKGLKNAKLKSHHHDPHSSLAERPSFPNNDLPPLHLPQDYEGSFSHPAQTNTHPNSEGEDDDDADKSDEAIFPAQVIRKERNSFFKTILNDENHEPRPGVYTSESDAHSHTSPASQQSPSASPPSAFSSPPLTVPGLHDPITAGLIDEKQAGLFFDLFFLRLNPFICLFDASLHSVSYVRSKCPFLFTTIIMACCKFFKPELYKQVHKLAQEFAVRAFADNWKRVEIVQAFACLTYWKEPDDTRTWTYIGYACRMAVELNLNRYVPKRSHEESDFQMLERRNRERTYLVLFVHDRSLSTQTGRSWMLPECDLVRHSASWHEEGGSPMQPQDVILASFVQLRRIATETTEQFNEEQKRVGLTQPSDVNHEVLLRNCNGKLSQWTDTWNHEMRRANGERFHFAFMTCFRVYVRLFLNSFGVQAALSPQTNTPPNLQALSACYTSALENLVIVTDDFAEMAMLRYGQDTITVMTAYSAVFLLRVGPY
ncbi:fungal-specific transcription factor domain-containing protein [Abortiporus biennis]|nr:fungal-specific transcription factor domain-containing protein [Abortiporus biennis]